MNKLASGSELLERTLPIASGDRSKKWRERPGRPTKRRGGRRGSGQTKPSIFKNPDKGKVEKLESKTSEPKDKQREDAEGLAHETSGSKVNVYV